MPVSLAFGGLSPSYNRRNPRRNLFMFRRRRPRMDPKTAPIRCLADFPA
jgi:hypothetical protein